MAIVVNTDIFFNLNISLHVEENGTIINIPQK